MITKATVKRNDKVLHKDGNIYDFGYWGQHGHAIVYKEGERNLQDAVACDPKDLYLPNGKVFELLTSNCFVEVDAKIEDIEIRVYLKNQHIKTLTEEDGLTIIEPEF